MRPITSLALSLAPELAPWLFGDDAAGISAAAARLVESLTGTPDPDGAKAVLSRDPAVSDALRAQLAQLAGAAEAAAWRARLAAATGARPPMTGGLGGGLPWGAPVVSLVVLLTFGAVMGVAMTRALPAGSETVVNMLLGSLGTMASAVVSYWVGSSAGSAAKTELLFHSQPAAPRTP